MKSLRHLSQVLGLKGERNEYPKAEEKFVPEVSGQKRDEGAMSYNEHERRQPRQGRAKVVQEAHSPHSIASQLCSLTLIKS